VPDPETTIGAMSKAERRKAANEALFRNVNERIQQLQRSFALAEHEPLQMICECGRLDCMTRITVEVDVYEDVRSHPDRFLVDGGHEDLTVEEVVHVAAGYTIVRKNDGDPLDVVAEADPRGS
jgi:diaminopimelate decarboxylase